jgi:hypothetical protein
MRHYTMFARFRETENRLQISLVETRRVAGKVRHEHIAGLGAVEMPPSVADRLVFCRKVEDRLAKLGNRLSAADLARIRGDLYARIPMPTADEQAAVQLANAQADAKLFATLHEMHAAVVADHQRLAGKVDSKIADGRAVLAEAAARLSAAQERVAAIERGEAVSGGLGKPLDVEAVLKADGWTEDDIRHCRDSVEVDAIARRLGGAEKVDRAITDGTVKAAEAAQRKLVQRLLDHEILAQVAVDLGGNRLEIDKRRSGGRRARQAVR